MFFCDNKSRNNYKYSIIFFTILCGFFSASHAYWRGTTKNKSKKLQQQCKRELSFKLPVPGKPITIVLHGTRVPIPGLLQNTCTPPGLHKLSDVSQLRFFARVAQAFVDADSTQFPLENMYLFGWGGDLCFDVREDEGAFLYSVIKTIKAMPEYYETPITIITHSHGGNVALNAGKAAQLDRLNKQNTALVDRLIIIAMPVQDATHDYCISPLFKKVYHFYSRQDMIQVADPQGMYEKNKKSGGCKTFFSRREFDVVDDKLKQIEVTWGNYPISHVDFVLSPGFIKRMPRILAFLDDPEKLGTLPQKAPGIYKLDYSKFKSKSKSKTKKAK